ncbi:MAG: hypothetical protein ACLR23_11945 [Clostridia bacterium]
MERKRDLCRFRLTGYRENFEGLDVGRASLETLGFWLLLCGGPG